MKIALYIEDGLEQVVLTPQGDTETAILKKLHDGSREFSVKSGTFYACMGGYTRQGKNSTDESTIIVLRKKLERIPALPIADEE